VYLFASQHEADRSRETDLFQGMHANPAFQDVTVREYDVLAGPTAITGPRSSGIEGTVGSLTSGPAGRD
jgi:hypothetical protein